MITAERLQALVNYSVDTGLFTWKTVRKGCKIGGQVGCIAKNGYIVIRLDDALYLAHRLVWLYVYKCWPSEQLDHINRIRSDNRLSNLREVSNAENAQNKRTKANKSGFAGVRRENSKWLAEIKVNYKPIRIGLFASPEEAHQSYIDAKRKYHRASTF